MIRMFHMLLLVAVVALPAAAQTRDRLGPRDLKDGPRVLEAFASITRGHAGSTMLVLADGKPVALATAVRTEGYLVTKASEISDGDIAVVLPGGGKLEAKVVGEDDAIDLALLRVDADDLKPVAWTDDERDPPRAKALTDATDIERELDYTILEADLLSTVINTHPPRAQPRRAYYGLKRRGEWTVHHCQHRREHGRRLAPIAQHTCHDKRPRHLSSHLQRTPAERAKQRA